MKKRSIGVSIFGWWYVIGGILGILNFPLMLIMRMMPTQGNTFFMKQFTGNFYLFYVLVMTIVSLITGIGILKLKQWARKLIIIICVIGVFYSIFVSANIATHSSEFVEASMSSHTMPKDTPPETLAAIKSFTQAIMIISMIAGMVFGVGFAIFVIWFFMRKSVREQFEPEKFQSAIEQIK